MLKALSSCGWAFILSFCFLIYFMFWPKPTPSSLPSPSLTNPSLHCAPSCPQRREAPPPTLGYHSTRDQRHHKKTQSQVTWDHGDSQCLCLQPGSMQKINLVLLRIAANVRLGVHVLPLTIRMGAALVSVPCPWIPFPLLYFILAGKEMKV